MELVLQSWVVANKSSTPLRCCSLLTSQGIKAIGIQGDVCKKEDAARVLEATVQHFGRLDILVDAAAGNFLVPAEDLALMGFE